MVLGLACTAHAMFIAEEVRQSLPNADAELKIIEIHYMLSTFLSWDTLMLLVSLQPSNTSE